MLKYTGVELDLITDTDMHQMEERDMRGVISNISHWYATSNHPNMDTYNENEETRILMYQDAYPLYSWAIRFLLRLVKIYLSCFITFLVKLWRIFTNGLVLK